MRTFKSFLYLTEARAKDVTAMYPHLGHLNQQHLSAYGMHLGKITSPSDDPIKIKSSIETFHRDKNALPVGQRDISKYKSIDEIRSALKPIQQKREAKQDVKVLYNDPKENIQIKHVRTRQACEAGYGGGKTSWCVAASGDGNLFDSYGEGGKKMFTIHHGDKVYGIHEHENGSIRNEQNKDVKNDMHPAIWKAMAKVPELSKVNIMSANPHITPEHITKALDDEDTGVRRAAIKHPKATSEHITKALDDEDSYVRRAALTHPKATPEHITKALDDENIGVRRAAIKHPKATSEHIDKALDDEDYRVREIALRHPNATPEHITKALDDEDSYVRRAAIEHPKATPEHITKALDDENIGVREAAIKHPKATSEHITKALDDEDSYVRRAAIKHPNATSEHIDRALDDKDAYVRELAIKHPNATPEQISTPLDDQAASNRRFMKRQKARLGTMK